MRITLAAALLILVCCAGEDPSDQGMEALRLASEAYRAGDPAAAEVHLRRALDHDPGNPLILHNLGVVLMETGRYHEAVEAFEKALEIHPSLDGILPELTGALVGADRIADAIETGENAVRRSPSSATAFNNLGRAYMEAGRFAEAASCFVTAVRRSPGSPSAHFNLGALHMLAGEPEEALPLLLETVRISPDYPGARTMLAAVYGMLGDLEGSEREALRALAMNGADLMAMNCLAMSYAGRDMRESAMEIWKTMLPLVDDSVMRADLLNRMEALCP